MLPNARLWPCQAAGARYPIQHHLWALLGVKADGGQRLPGYAGRSASASPACGSPKLHARQQMELIDVALSDKPVEDPGNRLEW